MRIAIVNNTTNIVENVIIANNLTDVSAASGQQTIDVTNIDCSVGSIYNGTTFSNSAIPALTIQQQKNLISAQLSALDAFIPRGLEDTWLANGFDTTKLPAIQQTRLAQKLTLRTQYNSL